MNRRNLILALAAAAQAVLPAVTMAQGVAVAGNGTSAAQDPLGIQQVAADYLRRQLSMLPGEPDIRIDDVRADRLPACDALSAFMTGTVRPRPRMSVGVRCSGPHTWNLYVQATVSMPGQYYVAARPIGAGETIGMEDLAPRDGDLVNLPPGAITDPQAILGMTARNRIGMGQTVRMTVLRAAGSVRRGQTVRITARGRGFVVSSEGQALANASPGAILEVKTGSGQIVSGILQPQGNVEVPL